MRGSRKRKKEQRGKSHLRMKISVSPNEFMDRSD